MTAFVKTRQIVLSAIGGLLVGLVASTGTAQTPSNRPGQPGAAPPTTTSPRPSTGTPQTSPTTGPQTSTSSATFEDWVMRCETKPPAPQICEIVQAIATRSGQQQAVIAQVVLGRTAKTAPVRVIIQVPVGVWLPAGTSIVMEDQTPAIPVSYTRCMQNICMAEADLKPETLQILRKQAKPGKLEFEDGTRRKVALPLSFKGFAAALDQSLKD